MNEAELYFNAFLGFVMIVMFLFVILGSKK
jgi:hypothetical protein